MPTSYGPPPVSAGGRARVLSPIQDNSPMTVYTETVYTASPPSVFSQSQASGRTSAASSLFSGPSAHDDCLVSPAFERPLTAGSVDEVWSPGAAVMKAGFFSDPRWQVPSPLVSPALPEEADGETIAFGYAF